MSNSYSNDTAGADIVATVGTLIKEGIAEKLQNKARYISVIIDRATDASNTENETVYVRCLGTDGPPVNRLVGHKPAEQTHIGSKLSHSLPI